MLVLVRRALVASAVVVVLAGCSSQASRTGSADALVQQSSASAVADSRARDAAQAAAVSQVAEQARLAAEAAAAEQVRLAAEAAAAQAAADKAAADKAAADKAAAAKAAAAKAAADKAAVAARAPAATRSGRSQPAPPAAPAVPQPPAQAAAHDGSYAAQLLSLTNAERGRAGLRPLEAHACAGRWAQSWARHLASTGTLAHQSLTTVLRDCGARGVAENVAFASTGASQMVAQWMASPGHRANILSPTATHLGVGAVQRADGRWYATQVFLTY